MTRDKVDLRWVWAGALGCFVLAGTTGALFRFGLLTGLPAGLQFSNIRHAHSHLMYFGWVTPLLMALMVSRLPQLIGRPLTRRFGPTIAAALLLGLLAYPFFLLYGYSLAEIGGKRLPLSMMAVSLPGFAWYAFVWQYWRETRGVRRPFALQLWDAALIALVVASLGGVGRVGLVILKVSEPFWGEAMVHLFLDLFSDGWFILALLGLVYAVYPRAETAWARRGTALVAVGLPATILLGIPSALVPEPLRLVGGVGGALVGAGLLLHVAALWPHIAAGWRIPLAFLALKAAAELSLVVPALDHWGEATGLRIPYLHWLLLGFVSLGLVQAAWERWDVTTRASRAWLTGAILALQLSLIPLTNLWPAAWAGRWALWLAAWAAMGPVVVALGLLIGHGGRRVGRTDSPLLETRLKP